MNEDERNKEKPDKARITYLPIGIGIGLPIGTAVGVALGNIAVGVGLGISFGVAASIILDWKKGNRAS